MQPGNPVVGGTALRFPAIQSPNFVTGVSGWIVRITGSAEFTSAIIRGIIDVLAGDGTEIVIDTTLGFAAIRIYPPGGSAQFTNGYVAANVGPNDATTLHLQPPIAKTAVAGDVATLDLNAPDTAASVHSDAQLAAGTTGRVILSVNAGNLILTAAGALNISLGSGQDFTVNSLSMPRGTVAAPISTTTDTSGLGATEGQDTNLGNYTFAAINGRRYLPVLANMMAVSGAANDRYILRLRNGGSGAPTNTSPIVAETFFNSPGANVAAPVPPFTAFVAGSTATMTLGLFVIRSNGANTATITSSAHFTSGTLGRQLHVEDIGT